MLYYLINISQQDILDYAEKKSFLYLNNNNNKDLVLKCSKICQIISNILNLVKHNYLGRKYT